MSKQENKITQLDKLKLELKELEENLEKHEFGDSDLIGAKLKKHGLGLHVELYNNDNYWYELSVNDIKALAIAAGLIKEGEEK